MQVSEDTNCRTAEYLPFLREDVKFVEKHGLRHAFHLGGNSSCRQHIRSHYEVYQRKCQEERIPENHYAVPRDVMRAREKGKNLTRQKTLDDMLETASKPKEFSRANVLKAVAEFVVCDDQVCEVML